MSAEYAVAVLVVPDWSRVRSPSTAALPRGEIELDAVARAPVAVTNRAVAPRSAGIWIRRPGAAP